jgi:hypothetical protein
MVCSEKDCCTQSNEALENEEEKESGKKNPD